MDELYGVPPSCLKRLVGGHSRCAGLFVEGSKRLVGGHSRCAGLFVAGHRLDGLERDLSAIINVRC